jgi:VIT1/CCC1 family predicted Fe2+/Mn2+ transporter
MAKSRKNTALYFRNFVFGVEDSLVSTVGLLSGIAIADTPRETIILSGVVLIFVEAFSMGVGSFLSEDAADELVEKKSFQINSVYASIIMFFSYFVSGFIPLAPYLLLETKIAFDFSIILSLITLFLLGALSAKYFRRGVFKLGLKMLLLGGIAVALGTLVGNYVHGKF